uniref:Uncharacterized protein n=1 Tax=Rhizophora mucronata TaxID=61149 RepID=A0A2P2IHX6_RHIMU
MGRHGDCGIGLKGPRTRATNHQRHCSLFIIMIKEQGTFLHGQITNWWTTENGRIRERTSK